MLAGAAVDALAETLHTDAMLEAVTQAIERDPVAAAPVVREVEQQFTDELAASLRPTATW